MSKDAFRATASDVLSVTVEELYELLAEANDYLAKDNYRSAIGTLALFDETAEDLKAAIRLYRSAYRRSVS